jgi:hypothetical protein
MTAYVSYCEASLEDGVLVAHLGSGPADEIIARSGTDPSIRICVREPSDDSVRFRARCGVATLTPDGLVPLLPSDPTELRGAWARLLPVGTHIWAILRQAHNDGRLDGAIFTGAGWLKVDGDVLESTNSDTARAALADSALAPPQATVFVRLGGRPEEVTQLLALLDADLGRADD